MVRRNVFEVGLKEKIVCHEVVDGGRAAFRNTLGVPVVVTRKNTYHRRRLGEEGGSY
jgi:hypothetical protein